MKRSTILGRGKIEQRIETALKRSSIYALDCHVAMHGRRTNIADDVHHSFCNITAIPSKKPIVVIPVSSTKEGCCSHG